MTPDEPRRAPIRWHVATVRDARTESSTARTLVLDGVFDLAAYGRPGSAVLVA